MTRFIDKFNGSLTYRNEMVPHFRHYLLSRNELFRILPPVSVTVSYFSVYNRWGNLVFSTANSGVGWDGSYNGKQQPTGTYIWEVEYLDPILNKKIRQNGTVILLR